METGLSTKNARPPPPHQKKDQKCTRPKPPPSMVIAMQLRAAGPSLPPAGAPTATSSFPPHVAGGFELPPTPQGSSHVATIELEYVSAAADISLESSPPPPVLVSSSTCSAYRFYLPESPMLPSPLQVERFLDAVQGLCTCIA